MKKFINIAMVIFICGGVIFGTWSDRAYVDYIDKGLTPPQSTFCLYNNIQSIWGGIVGIWIGINLIYKASLVAKFVANLFGKADSPVDVFLTMCFGLIWLVIGVLSFWNVYTSNVQYCGIS